MTDTSDEVRAKIAARVAARDAAFDDQLAKDEAAYLALLDEHEPGALKVVKIERERYVPGVVTQAVYRLPTRAESQRFTDECKTRPDGKPGNAVAAGNLLAASCRVYPDKDAYTALCERYSMFNLTGGNTIALAAQGAAGEAGKD